MKTNFSSKFRPLFFLIVLLLGGLSTGYRPQTATAGSLQSISVEFQHFMPIILNGAGDENVEGDFVFTALRDANLVFPEGPGLNSFLQTQKLFLCDLFSPPPTVPMNYEQALASAWAYLNQQVGASNLATFRTLPEAATADTAQAFAVAALADRRPDGALTSLLVAAEKAPNDPMILVSAAGVLNMLGMPNEALAFLDKAATLPGAMASPMAISGEQMAANNRGHALMLLGKWAEAETVLRPVVEAEAQLSEARTNLSIALLCQDKDEEAGYFYRLGARRMLYDAVEHGEEVGGRLPLDLIYDRTAGQSLVLPGIPIAGTLESAEGVLPIYEQMMAAHQARFQQNADQIQALIDEIHERQPTLPLLTNLRYANVIGAINSANQEPYIKALEDAYADADTALTELYNQHSQELNDLLDQGLPPEQFYPACQSLLSSQWASEKLAMQAVEEARREHAAALYYEQTGLAANLADPLHHEVASLMAKQDAESAFGDLVGMYSTRTGGMLGLWLECLGGQESIDASGGAPTFNEAQACPNFVKGVKLAVKIAGLTMNVNCEKIEMEAAASQALGLFGQVTVDFARDNVTAFVGAKAKINIGPVELSAKEGLYVTANKGGLTDAGMKVSTTGAITNGTIAGKIDGPGFEFSVVSAMEYITGP